MSVSKGRGFLYCPARLLEDWQTLSSSSGKKMAKRAGRRTVAGGDSHIENERKGGSNSSKRFVVNF